MLFSRSAPILKPLGLPDTQLYLRAPIHRDYAAWKQVRETSREFLIPWEPRWPENDLTRLGFRTRLKRYERERETGTGETYFLVSTTDERPIGGISISNIRYGVARMCNIGYWMGEEHAGKGHMSLAVSTIARHIFDDLNLCRIEAGCLPHNKRSSRLLERVGFSREGLLRQYLEINGRRADHVLYSLLRDDGLRDEQPETM